MDEDPDIDLDDLSPTPALEAMRVAMRLAEEAALARLQAKNPARSNGSRPPRDAEMLAELALVDEPLGPVDPAMTTYALGEGHEIEALIAKASEQVPDVSN